jgi:transcriptional regulator with XRE-family HTH domain
MIRLMFDQRLGASFRAVRLRHGWRQIDVAARARVSDSLISAVERGHLSTLSVESLRKIALSLDMRVDVIARWRGGDLERVLNSRHAALAGGVTTWLRSLGWEVAPEVSFAVRGERGFIDLMAWHAATRTLLVIEIKTEIVDVHELLGVMDRKTRLAPEIARERGWTPAAVATWLVVEEGSTNRHRVDRFAALLRTSFPADARSMTRWLRAPSGTIRGLSFFSDSSPGSAKQRFPSKKRVRVAR